MQSLQPMAAQQMQPAQSLQPPPANRATPALKRLAITAGNAEAQANAESRNPYVQKINEQRNQGYQTRGNAYRAQGYQTGYQPIYQQPSYQPISVPTYHVDPTPYAEQYYSAPHQKAVAYFGMGYTDPMSNLVALEPSAYYAEPSPEAYYAEEDHPDDTGSAVDAATETSTIKADVFHSSIEIETDPHKRLSCRECRSSFSTRNKLFRHLEEEHDPKCRVRKDAKATADNYHVEPSLIEASSLIESTTLIESDAVAVPDTGLAFRSYHYATIPMGFTWKGVPYSVCLDTGCTMTLIDRQFLKELRLGRPLKKSQATISVRGVGTERHLTDDYLVMDLYIKGKVEDKDAVAHLRREVHVVDNLKAKLLLGMDVMVPERMIVNLDLKKLTVGSCKGLKTSIKVTSKDNTRIRRTLKAERKIVVEANTIAKIPITFGEPLPDRDYLFEPRLPGAYAHVVDASLSSIYVSNTSALPITIPRQANMGRLVEFEEQGCYQISPEDHIWAARKDIQVNIPEDGSQRTLPNGVHIYGSNDEVASLEALVKEFSTLWEDTGETVNLPEKDWMTVPLTTDWNSVNAPRIVHKVYPLGERDRQVIDEEFDKLHKQGKMKWSTRPTPFGFPVFVVWRTVNGPDGQPTRKHRVVTDIRGLNKLSTTDGHSIPMQSDIIAHIRGSNHISLMNGLAFFLQFSVAEEDRHKFSFITHRGKEQLNVAAMGFKNSPFYVQRVMDEQLRELREFCRVYIDDIVAFSKTFAAHQAHLRRLFAKLVERRVTLSPKKTYMYCASGSGSTASLRAIGPSY